MEVKGKMTGVANRDLISAFYVPTLNFEIRATLEEFLLEEFQKNHESDVFQIILKESEAHQIRVKISPDLLEASGN